MQLRHAANTDNGRARDHNEDTFVVEPAPDRAEAGALFVVCDGMGGFAAGEVASDLAAKTITRRYYAGLAADPVAGLREAFVEANQRIFQQGRGKMGTTGVAALFLHDRVMLANVGDSRAYLLRAGEAIQLTRDHSFVEEQVAAGVITADQARGSSYRNIITRALGHRPEVEVDLYHEQVMPGDRILLCSDGLYTQAEPREIAELGSAASLQHAVQSLIDIANERGGPDNITAVLVEVVEVDSPNGAPAPGRTERLASAPAPRTAKLPAAAAPPGAPRTTRLHAAPQLRSATAPPPPVAVPRRGPVIGLILMVLVALALLGAIAWFVVNNGLGSASSLPTPAVPTLTPLTSTTAGPGRTVSPTFVPTAVPKVR